jgi:hypothetical protein
LPPGITLGGTGQLTGTPTQAGVFDFTARVTDSAGGVDLRAYRLEVLRNATSVRFEVAPNPAVAGQPVTVSAIVDSTGGGAAGGNLIVWVAGTGARCPDPFEAGPAPVTTILASKALAGGAAQVVFPQLGIDNFRVCALYEGDGLHEPSRFGPVELFVIKGVLLPAPKVGLAVPQLASPGSTVEAIVVVQPLGTTRTPGGRVRLHDGVRDLGGGTLEGGVAHVLIGAPAVEGATMSVSAVYEGDGVFAASASDATTVTASKAVIGGVEPIPALDHAALLAMMLALAALGARRIARRRR